MELVVEPSFVSGTGAAVRSLSTRVPDLPRTFASTSGNAAVDDAVSALTRSADDGLWDAGAALHDLGKAAVDAAAAIVATDRSLR